MRKILLFAVVVWMPLILLGQEERVVNVEKISFNLLEEVTLKEQFLEPRFNQGTVFFKNGKTTKAYLNYNVITNGVVFLDGEKRMLTLMDLPSIKLISFSERSFIPINQKEVAELIETFSDGTLLLFQRDVKINSSDDNSGPYGSNNKTSSVEKYSAVYDQGVYHDLNKSIEVKVTYNYKYVLLRNGKFTTIKKLKDLKKAYPDKWEEVKTQVEGKSSSDINREYLLNLIKFCNAK